jgi:ABC-2 type transport system permease protein
MLVIAPLLQLILFSMAATLEVKNVALMILNEDAGRHGHELVQRLSAAKVFSRITFAGQAQDYETALDGQKILAAVHIPRQFSKNLEGGGRAGLQIILDGRKSNSSQIANAYLTRVIRQYGRELSGVSAASQVRLDERYWFNENLEYTWFTIPSLVAILTVVITISLAAMSVAREREMGTFEQLLVSPLNPLQILIGKLVPAMAIGIAEAIFILAMGRLLFGIPFRGSPLMMLASIALFSYSIVGFGLFISSLARTQQQAIIGAFVFMVPAISLSGFATPVENMPQWLQSATGINPMKHALIIFKGLFLKDMPPAEVLSHLWPLPVIGTASLIFSAWLFTRRLG